jgi:hypothetical protein
MRYIWRNNSRWSVLAPTSLSSRPLAPLLPFFDDFADLEELFELDLVELAINYQMRTNIFSTPKRYSAVHFGGGDKRSFYRK